MRDAVDEIVAAYPALERGAVAALVRRIEALREQGPDVDLSPGAWRIPKDATRWDVDAKGVDRLAVRPELEKLARHLREAEALAWWAVNDATARAALQRVVWRDADDRDDRDGGATLGDCIGSLSVLREAVEDALGLRGQPGNRPNPAWHVEAARECRRFCEEQPAERRPESGRGFFFTVVGALAQEPTSAELATAWRWAARRR